jgi:hypothetical protein
MYRLASSLPPPPAGGAAGEEGGRSREAAGDSQGGRAEREGRGEKKATFNNVPVCYLT